MDRKERLQLLADEYHRSKYGDYDDTYSQFAAAYGLKYEDDEVPALLAGEELEEIPRYVITFHDETYSMMSTYDNIDDALQGLLEVVGQGDTLNIPGYLIDLDTGDVLGYSMSIKLTGEKLEVNHLDYLKENA